MVISAGLGENRGVCCGKREAGGERVVLVQKMEWVVAVRNRVAKPRMRRGMSGALRKCVGREERKIVIQVNEPNAVSAERRLGIAAKRRRWWRVGVCGKEYTLILMRENIDNEVVIIHGILNAEEADIVGIVYTRNKPVVSTELNTAGRHRYTGIRRHSIDRSKRIAEEWFFGVMRRASGKFKLVEGLCWWW